MTYLVLHVIVPDTEHILKLWQHTLNEASTITATAAIYEILLMCQTGCLVLHMR